MALVPLVALAAIPAVADQFDATPVRDATLYQEGDLSCGTGASMISGSTNNSALRRAAVQFDFSGIPAGSTVQAVTISMTITRSRDGQDASMALHTLSEDWGEGSGNCDGNEGQGVPAAIGDATWTHSFFDSLFWGSGTSPGGSFAPVESAVSLVGSSGVATWSGASGSTLASEVENWINNPGSNFGWILLGDETRAQSTRRFASREATSAGDRPLISVTFTPPTTDFEPCCDVVGSCSFESVGTCGGTTPGGNACTIDLCPTAEGACCLPDPDLNFTCSILNQGDCAGQGGTFQGPDARCQENTVCGLEPWRDELPIPQPLQPVRTNADGLPEYDITVTEFEQQLHRDLPDTTVWGYNGSYPGGTLETRVDEPISVNFINDLRDSSGALRDEHFLPVDECAHGPNYWKNTARTVVHLHGMHGPWRVDGHPEFDYPPGELDTYVYPNFNQLPATLWYHDHALGITRLNVYMGLAGFYLLRDDVEDALGLPSGEFEIPLVIQDRQFNLDTGRLVYPGVLQQTFFGDSVLVNGKVWPTLDVKKGKYRFRLLNGSNSRVYTLSLSDGASFELIGTDGGLITSPRTLSELTLAPAERAEVVIDFASYDRNTEIILKNSAPIKFPNPNNPSEGVLPNVMKFIVGRKAGHTDPLPATMRPVIPIPESEATNTRTFNLVRVAENCAGGEWLAQSLDPQGNVIGEHWDDISELPVVDTTEIWEFINSTAIMHPMHMHLVMFQVLDRTDLDTGEVIPLSDYDRDSWKDTVKAMPNTKTRVIARFEDYTGKFAWHCHILEHEDHEMMRQFQVSYDAADCNGDGVCDPSEDCISCPTDCAEVSGAECGNRLCETGDGESFLNCPDDCAGDGSFTCGDPAIDPSYVNCSDPRCTSTGFFCRAKPRVVACCGDQVCQGQETSAACGIDCGGGPPVCTPTEASEVTCDDGLDNDCDGDIDAADTDCQVCTPTEASEVTCDDGLDNDCDGDIDAADTDCQVCTPTEASEVTCDDGLDNDCDGDIDAADTDCQVIPGCNTDGVCDPGEDCLSCPDDCDGKLNGNQSNRYCCGDGIAQSPEGNGAICDGNF